MRKLRLRQTSEGWLPVSTLSFPLYRTAKPSLKQLHQLPDPNAVRKKGPSGGVSRSLGPPHVQHHTDGFCLPTLKS